MCATLWCVQRHFDGDACVCVCLCGRVSSRGKGGFEISGMGPGRRLRGINCARIRDGED